MIDYITLFVVLPSDKKRAWYTSTHLFSSSWSILLSLYSFLLLKCHCKALMKFSTCFWTLNGPKNGNQFCTG